MFLLTIPVVNIFFAVIISFFELIFKLGIQGKIIWGKQ